MRLATDGKEAVKLADESIAAPSRYSAIRPELFERAMLIRGVEQRFLSLYTEGKLFGTGHTCIGQEWTGIAVAHAVRDDDVLFSTHRCHGHYLARTGDVEGLIAEVMGKRTGMCGGRGGSQHIHAPGFFSNGIQGGTMPIAAGRAFSQKMSGSTSITVVFIGDGTLGEGTVYEALNVAAKWELPVLVVLENNRYAQSTSQSQTLAGDICARASAFGISTARADTWDLEQLLERTRDAVSSVRAKSRPFFLQIDTYRLMAHSKGDDTRDAEELRKFWERDPITIWKSEQPLAAAAVEEQIKKQIDTAVELAEAAGYGDVAEVQHPASTDSQKIAWKKTRNDEKDRVVNRIHASLQRNLRSNQRIILIGEDIEGPYGGAFKVTKLLSQEFPGRVCNTPISEATIVGLGNGLALGDWLPVCEIMFGDFLTLAFDQILNHAAKFRYMYNDQVRVPLVIRTPMGGKRGYGATHSQSTEKHFLGIPDTVMLALHTRYDPALVYDRLLETVDRPTIVIENKLMYGSRVTDQVGDGFFLENDSSRFPTTRIRPQGKPDVTVLCYGGMLADVEESIHTLFDEREIICEVICPLQIYPLDIRPVLESVQVSGRLVIVEEGQGFAGFGAEVIAQIVERRPGVVRRLRRVAATPHAIPGSGPMEKKALPGVSQIVEAVAALIGEESA
ncbi:MAG: thiamine pyrophosphate-dependent enzyme [Tepidisphaeraceae bacterium]|jgi:2-oxoisovalerate dehydrogenase E1 component